MKTINTITPTFPEILAIYFIELWTQLGMPEHPPLKKSHDQTIASMNVSQHAKNLYNNSFWRYS